MSHTFVNYPSDTNRMTKLVRPAGDLNGSAAALNASIQALTDAIAAAQAVLATLVPYTGASENVDLNGKDLTNIGTSGDNPALAVNTGAITSLDGGAIITDGSGNALFANRYIGVNASGFYITLDGTGSVFGDGFGTAMFLGGNVGVGLEGSTITLDGYGSFISGGPGGASFARGAAVIDGDGNGSFASGVITVGNTGGTAAWINSDGSASFGEGGLEVSSNGTISSLQIGGGVTPTFTLSVDGANNLVFGAPYSTGGWCGIEPHGNFVLSNGQWVGESTNVTYARFLTTDLQLFANAITVMDATTVTVSGTTYGLVSIGHVMQLEDPGVVPTAVAGGIYFDGTNFNFCADGSTWVALTLP